VKAFVSKDPEKLQAKLESMAKGYLDLKDKVAAFKKIFTKDSWALGRLVEYYQSALQRMFPSCAFFWDTPHEQPAYASSSYEFSMPFKGEAAICLPCIDFSEMKSAAVDRLFNVLAAAAEDASGVTLVLCSGDGEEEIFEYEKGSISEARDKFHEVYGLTGEDSEDSPSLGFYIWIEDAPDLKALHNLGLSVSRKGKCALSVKIPKIGFDMGYNNGDIDTGNADSFGLVE
jgi:hypothetical protein